MAANHSPNEAAAANRIAKHPITGIALFLFTCACGLAAISTEATNGYGLLTLIYMVLGFLGLISRVRIHQCEERNEQLEKRNERLEERNEQLRAEKERLMYDLQRRGNALDDVDARTAIRRGLLAAGSCHSSHTSSTGCPGPSGSLPASLPPGPPSSDSSGSVVAPIGSAQGSQTVSLSWGEDDRTESGTAESIYEEELERVVAEVAESERTAATGTVHERAAILQPTNPPRPPSPHTVPGAPMTAPNTLDRSHALPGAADLPGVRRDHVQAASSYLDSRQACPGAPVGSLQLGQRLLESGRPGGCCLAYQHQHVTQA